MSIDSRLRQSLQRSMSAIDADADRLLDDARRRGHRRIVVQRVTALVVLAATAGIVAFAGPAVLDVLRNQRPEPANPSPLPLTGTYTTTIPEQEGAGDPRVVGTWLMTLERDGTLDLASLTNGDVSRTVTQYQVDEDEFLTTALADSECPGVGRYTWTRIGSTLKFVVVDDACALRESIFSSRPWNTT